MLDFTGEVAASAIIGGVAIPVVFKIGLAIAGTLSAIALVDVIVDNPPIVPTVSFPEIGSRYKIDAEPKVVDLAPPAIKDIPKIHIHHIVAQRDHRASESRAILIDVGIDYKHDPINLVPLVQEFHAKLHTTAYHNYVTERLRLVAGDREGVEKVLNELKTEILAHQAAGIRW